MKRLILVLIVATMLIAVISTGAAQAKEKTVESIRRPAAASLKAKDFSYLLGTLGFSDTLLNNHFLLYQGYVKNTNAVLERLAALSAADKDKTSEYAELKRRLGWEFDGVLLHEYYFENLGANGPIDGKSAVYKKLTEEFGSLERWKRDFISTGSMRGIGWVVLYQEPRSGKLINAWINEHDVGHLAGARPLLVMDVFEHAYMPDYQLDRAKYIEAFFKNINWQAVDRRFNK
jgi:Fe-Mn family superoxide dismutase